jgi:hypothetical protein
VTKAQQTYERTNALVEGGMSKADAFKQLAEEYQQPVDSVRGAYYGHKRIVDTGGQPTSGRGSTRRPRKRETTTQDAIASAVASLRGAVDAIEAEVEAARERAEEANAEYAAMQAAAPGRIEEIRAKIAMLDPTPAAPPETKAVAPEADAGDPPAAKPTGKAAQRKEATGS